MSIAQPGTVMVDRYRLTRPASTDLAAAQAWEAHDQILDRPVRVTFVDGPNAPAALDAARRAALVADPRLCRVLDVGTTDLGSGDTSYVITEPYAGESLTQIISRGLVDAQQARALVGEAATALDAAHQRGVHHLALRPEAVRVDGHRVVVTGLGVDAGVAGTEASGAAGAAADARGLVALGYYALTARWPADPLEVDWISPDAVRPLPAQTGPDGVVAVSQLVPHVDPELDALVRRTFGAHGDEAPATPGEVIAALEPWGQVSVMAALPQFVQPTAERPVRSSVLGAGSPPGTEPRPGTPPPAPPVRRPSTGRIARAGAVGAAAGAGGAWAAQQTAAQGPPYQQTAAYGQPPAAATPTAPAAATQVGQPPTPPPPSGQQGYAQPGYAPAAAAGAGQGVPPSSTSPATGGFASTPAPKRRGVNPTPIVLGLLLVGVVLGAVWAVSQVFTPFDTTPIGGAATSAAPTQEAEESPSEDEGSAEPTESEEPEVRPIIESGSQLDPYSDGEHPEAVELAYDSDPSTFWYTRTYYNDPAWGGFKPGAGFDVVLREPAPVSAVELNTNSSGGAWELRQTSADDPEGGEVLAKGSFSPDTQIELDKAVVLDEFVLWITELPTTDGENRLELNEITLS
ncbi:protein kinase family protein [Isoptericola aurantiacus]|uniref:hypothetical protein n=1 Tax=Isoptericola aurantiacus TaxID=3377839 RepID=UPI00383A94FC